jgi:hypothetical protein
MATFMGSAAAFVASLKEDPKVYEILSTKLGARHIKPTDVYAVRDKVSIDPATIVDRLDTEIIPTIIKHQTEEMTDVCTRILETSIFPNASFLPPAHDAVNKSMITTILDGNPILYLPTHLFEEFVDWFPEVYNDIRCSFGCSCMGGIGSKECTSNCVINGINRLYGTTLRRWVSEMVPYCDESIGNDFYVVKPYIRIIESGPETIAGQVAFRVHVYTVQQAMGAHMRIKTLLSLLEYPHAAFKVVTSTVPEYNVQRGIQDSRTNFYRIRDKTTDDLLGQAGTCPKGAIIIPPRVAAVLIGKDHSTISKSRKAIGIPSFNIMIIPCNIYRMHCITCRELIDEKKRAAIMSKVMGVVRSLHNPVGDKW